MLLLFELLRGFRLQYKACLFFPHSQTIVGAFRCITKMSYQQHSSTGSGSRTARRTFEFGRTYVVRPKGKHQATVVWLHGLGDNGSSWSQLLENLPLPNIKWICPTAPTRSVSLLGGFSCTAWFDVGEISENSPDDLEGLDASAAHIANLLSTEPTDVKVGIGGFSMGAATALYSATCAATGRYSNGNLYPIKLRAVVGLSGWLPGSRGLRNKIEGSHEAARRAASLPILVCHGTNDDVVSYNYGEQSANLLHSAGFQLITFKKYDGLGHYTVPTEMNEVHSWLKAKLNVE
ncbi:acyl-protein thioesterase 2 isoform X2 [Manihot esculenta]|nr:acyl-protein thioesterase 2 isoform X2 [Manihot esculenta]